MSEVQRERIKTRIIEAVSMMIISGEIKDPRLNTLCSITDCTLSPDYAYATLYVSSPFSDGSVEKSVKALNSASSFIQGRLGKILKTRNTPVLTFKLDSAFREGEKLNELISSLVKDENDGQS